MGKKGPLVKQIKNFKEKLLPYFMNMFWKGKYGYKWKGRHLHANVQKALEHI